jgi:ABC-type sugar transport system permease subunit
MVRDYLFDYATPEEQLYKSMIALILLLIILIFTLFTNKYSDEDEGRGGALI